GNPGQARYRTGDHDRAAGRVLLEKLPHGLATAEKHPLRVDAHHTVPVVVRSVHDRADVTDTRVREENVHATEFRTADCDCTLDVVRSGHVHRHGPHAKPRRGQADAPGGAREQRDLALETVTHRRNLEMKRGTTEGRREPRNTRNTRKRRSENSIRKDNKNKLNYVMNT